jgi:hypothetical protein
MEPRNVPLKDAPGLHGKHEEKRTMMVVAYIDLPPLALASITFIGVLLAVIGTLFLAYDLLGRENGPLRWFTLVLTCGIVSTLIFVPVVMLDHLLFRPESLNLSFLLLVIVAGGIMGFYTVILVELPPSDTKPPMFSWKGGLLGLALVFLFWLVGVLAGPQYDLPALTAGIACALLTCTWQRLTWEPAQAGATAHGIGQVVAGEKPSASTPTPSSTEQFEAWKPAHPKPHLFSPKGWLLGLLFGFLLGFAFFFTANKDIIASLLESVPLALISGVICGIWRFINWEPPHPRPHLFSRKGFWTGLVGGFVPWLLFALAAPWDYTVIANSTGPIKGFGIMISLFINQFIVGFYALASATAGSITQYTLWKANQVPHRILGAFGVVLIIVAFALQGVQPAIDILNYIK